MAVKKAEVRLITIGDSATGKSSLILRYTKGVFREERKATVGIDLRIKSVNIDGRPIKVKIWDTAGQEQFRTITRNYYRGAQGVALVYDITNQTSFTNVKKWISDVETYGDSGVKVVLVGNKVDLEEDRKVSSAEGQAVASQHGVEFFETSALSGSSVDSAFGSLVKHAARKIPVGNDESIDINAEKKSKGCCK
eukprot:CAMPEP_0114524030 /NCGR_PEP_ID=MMETSP0109-20121206/21621_1 /TAXON_ID=29199 /ORGANISM="Chlorarachnion reptans, Strain CCCM449" /LENGTH=193 /DNA_ID=CAMNT_0001705413 /DNA_START=31 /DNA_END=612 /DNA_ORIENTATION=-